jgi:GntR family transcriptional regulator/MocR family aminotransferase
VPVYRARGPGKAIHQAALMILLPDSPAPLHLRLFDALRLAIVQGELPVGSRLPSTRALSDTLKLSRNTVISAYAELYAQGFVEPSLRRGNFVSAHFPRDALALAPSEVASVTVMTSPALSSVAPRARLALAGPLPEPVARPAGCLGDFALGALLPGDLAGGVWRQLWARELQRPQPGYGIPEGYRPLREEISRWLARTRGISVTTEEILLVQGTHRALDLASRLLLDLEDLVVLEEAHCLAARALFQLAGARLAGCPLDDAGLRVDALAADGPPRLVYVTPANQFPLGMQLCLERRQALVERAARDRFWIIEDDYEAEIHAGGPPLPSLRAFDRHGVVLHIGTFSRTAGPDSRLAYLVVPAALAEPARRLAWVLERQAPLLPQRVLAEFIAGGHFERQARRLRRRLGQRRERLLAALRDQLGDRAKVLAAGGGSHLAVEFPRLAPGDLALRLPELRRRGFAGADLADYYLSVPGSAGLLLGFGGMAPESIPEAVGRLAGILLAEDE